MTPQDAPRGQFESRMRLRRSATCVSAARIAMEEGRALEAQERLEEACRLDPDSLEARILLEQLRAAEPEDEPPAVASLDEPLSRGARRWSHWVAVLIAVAALTALAFWRGPVEPQNQVAPARPAPPPRTEPRREAPAMAQSLPAEEAIPSDTTGNGPAERDGTDGAPRTDAPPLERLERGTSGRSPSPVAADDLKPEAVRSSPPPIASPPAPAVPGLSEGRAAMERVAAPSPSPSSVPDAPAGSEPAPATDAAPASLRDTAAAEEAIGEVLARYVDAYNRLDARAARQVWPSVDERALARAFAGLESQGVSFEACDLAVDGDEAIARCSGRARFVPRVGDRDAISQPRRWTFRLRGGTAGWHIVQAEAR